MTAEHSTYTYETGKQETVTFARGHLTPHGHAVLKIDHGEGRSLDCYVNTAWLRDRLNDLDPRPLAPDDITDEMRKRARAERERLGRLVQDVADGDGHATQIDGVKIAPCDTFGRTNAENAERTRAEEAERERDDLRAQLEADSDVNYLLREDRDAWKRKASESRALTPDAITDEMVERARAAYRDRDPNTVSREWMPAVLTAALTEPPARPEGAERWEDFLIDSLDYQALTDQQIANLADRIAEEMNR